MSTDGVSQVPLDHSVAREAVLTTCQRTICLRHHCTNCEQKCHTVCNIEGYVSKEELEARRDTWGDALAKHPRQKEFRIWLATCGEESLTDAHFQVLVAMGQWNRTTDVVGFLDKISEEAEKEKGLFELRPERGDDLLRDQAGDKARRQVGDDYIAGVDAFLQDPVIESVALLNEVLKEGVFGNLAKAQEMLRDPAKAEAVLANPAFAEAARRIGLVLPESSGK